jgi:hypothetical protein
LIRGRSKNLFRFRFFRWCRLRWSWLWRFKVKFNCMGNREDALRLLVRAIPPVCIYFLLRNDDIA